MLFWNTETVSPLLGYVLILLFGAWPILSVLLTYKVADWLGCEVNEGNPRPCKCCGVDIGGLLYFGGVSGWFTFITVPAAAVLLVVWTIIVLVN